VAVVRGGQMSGIPLHYSASRGKKSKNKENHDAAAWFNIV